MNIAAHTISHPLLATALERTIQGVKMFYDKDKAKALNLMRPMIVLGKPGIGKTMGIREMTDRLGIGYKELRLACMSELDLAGLPMVKENEEDGVSETTYAASSMLPKSKRDGEYGILALDEISSCSRAARAVALQLLDSSRGVGEYKLPDKWICVGLGNDADDGGIFDGLEGAFLNRCRCVRLEADFNSWQIWADAKGINSAVMAFLKCYPQMFYVDPIEGDSRIGASPRSWEGVSTQLDFAEEINGGPLTGNDTEYFVGVIGSDLTPDIAARFAAFYAYNREMTSPEDVLSGKVKLSSSDAGASEAVYMTIEACIASLIKQIGHIEVAKLTENHQQMVANFIKYIGQLQATKGGEAAVSGLEQLCTRVKPVSGLLMHKTFMTKFPTEFKLLVATASKLNGL